MKSFPRHHSKRKNQTASLRSGLRQVFALVTDRPDLLWGFILIIAAGVAFEMFSVGVDHIVEKRLDGEHVKKEQLCFIAVCFLFMVLLTVIIWWQRHVFRSIHVRYKIASSAGPRPYLVIFVSRQEILKEELHITDDGPVSIMGAELARKDLLKDANLLDQSGKWPWEMILRAIHPHRLVLNRIYLVGSKDVEGKNGLKRGSFGQLDILRRFIAPYLVAAGRVATPSGAANMIVTWSDPVDFESLDEVHDLLDDIRGNLLEELADEADLCVDITGGQKPTSAAAGLFTVNKEVVLQYVQTNDPKEPQIHDVRLLEWPSKLD